MHGDLAQPQTSNRPQGKRSTSLQRTTRTTPSETGPTRDIFRLVKAAVPCTHLQMPHCGVAAPPPESTGSVGGRTRGKLCESEYKQACSGTEWGLRQGQRAGSSPPASTADPAGREASPGGCCFTVPAGGGTVSSWPGTSSANEKPLHVPAPSSRRQTLRSQQPLRPAPPPL